MDFRLEFNPKLLPEQIDLKDKVFMIGSCFTEQMGAKLDAHLFQTFQNPSGILFNPFSICTSIEQYIQNKAYSEADLFYHNELWGSWDHHTRFSDAQKDQCLQNINTSIRQAYQFIHNTQWMIITLGSSFAYRREGKFVANCHKVPTDKFEKVLLRTEEIRDRLTSTIHWLREVNPGIRILFTISPVRHLRDGFIENNRSKAHLISAVHELIQKSEKIFYFPAYELIIDDLRDYRFYAEDMVHPNYAATNYVWEKFKQTVLSQQTRDILPEIDTLNNAYRHKPFHPDSKQHKHFLEIQFKRALELKNLYPFLDIDHFIKKFSGQ